MAIKRDSKGRFIQGSTGYWNGKKRPAFSEQWKKNMARDGQKNGFYGRRHTQETKNKIRQMQLGRKCPEHSEWMLKYSPLLGTHRSEGTKRKISKANKGQLQTHGKHQKYKNIWMRSTWEVKYAKYLDRNNIKWLYESKTFNLGGTTYTPDFYLSETNEYIEIKGYWRDDAKKKFKLFKKKYLTVMIKVLMKNDLKRLGIL